MARQQPTSLPGLILKRFSARGILSPLRSAPVIGLLASVVALRLDSSLRPKIAGSDAVSASLCEAGGLAEPMKAVHRPERL